MKLLASCSPGEIRVAAMTGDEMVDFAIWRPGCPDGVGDLHRGQVAARVSAMAGCFVRLAGGAEGFLPDSDAPEGLTEGAAVGVRVRRAARGGKGPRLTARISDSELTLVEAATGLALLRRGPGAVEVLAARHPGAEVAVDDAGVMARLRPALEGRLRLVTAAFDAETEAAVAALGEVEAALPGGARMSVTPTPALVAIDVDLGAASAMGGSKTRAQMAANRALLPALARQIRLRSLAGAIVVDLGGLPVRARARLALELTSALADDPAKPRVLGITALGLIEILRPGAHPPLHEMLAGPHAAGLAGLRAADSLVRATPASAPILHAAPAVEAALSDDTVARDDWTRRTGRPWPVRAEATMGGCQWRLEP